LEFFFKKSKSVAKNRRFWTYSKSRKKYRINKLMVGKISMKFCSNFQFDSNTIIQKMNGLAILYLVLLQTVVQALKQQA
jgi:hypothetical protein